ncbi:MULTISPECIES: hypothetical protein [Achromobacter]|uniref:Uncharacterized protein n=1 Tax=Achromobacter aegrifaciens TaxID=1287736 RepID=A0AAD2J4L2_ACHAE|nr:MULTISPECIES: hypothetical protein [Achromobacter]CAB3921305.1 hypothetical protein LMG26684_05727 [Achromobacter mucicolens]CUJ70327.1 Uncharacterised protein [Achromobacter aegrifaciens]
MPLTDLAALIQSKPAVLLAGFLSSLCLLLLASEPYMVRAYRKQGRRFSGDAGTAPSEDLHRDSTNTRPVPTVSYSMLTAETGHHIGHQLRLGNVQSAEALYRFWESLSPSIEDPTSREFACTFAKAIAEALECPSTSAPQADASEAGVSKPV